MEDSSAARKTGHRPYLMPDGSRLTSYLGDAAAEHKPRKAKKGGRKSCSDRGGTHGVRVLSGPGAQESREELEALMRVGREKRTRWLNDKLLRDMAGALTARNMEALFKPVPFGETGHLTALSEAVTMENQALWDLFRSIDFDKQSRVLERWEDHVRSTEGPARPSAALAALRAWGCINRKARDALKRAPPSLVDEIELRILQYLEQEESLELVLQLDDGFQRLLAHGLAEFHSLASASRDAPSHECSLEAPQALARAGECSGGSPKAPNLDPEAGAVRLAVPEQQAGVLRMTVLWRRAGSATGSSGGANSGVEIRNAAVGPGVALSPRSSPAITCADIVYALGEHPAGMTPDVLKAYVAAHLHDDRSSQASFVMV